MLIFHFTHPNAWMAVGRVISGPLFATLYIISIWLTALYFCETVLRSVDLTKSAIQWNAKWWWLNDCVPVARQQAKLSSISDTLDTSFLRDSFSWHSGHFVSTVEIWYRVISANMKRWMFEANKYGELDVEEEGEYIGIILIRFQTSTVLEKTVKGVGMRMVRFQVLRFACILMIRHYILILKQIARKRESNNTKVVNFERSAP